jgi:hypothetical protein
MKKYLFSSKLVAVVAAVGAMAAVPAVASANSSNSTTIFVTAQGTSVLGHELPVIGTQGYDITLPINSQVLPQAAWNALDFTITGQVNLGGLQLANVYIDPQMVR